MTSVKQFMIVSLMFSGFIKIFSTELKSQNLPKWNDEYHKNWWMNHGSVSEFTQSVELLNKQINEHLNKDGIVRLSQVPSFFELVANTFCAKYFVVPYLNKHQASDNASFKQIQKFISNNFNVPGYLTRCSHYKDNKIEVIKILLDLKNNDPKIFADYIKLAIAVSLVWDVEFPDSWPHQNVSNSDLSVLNPHFSQPYNFIVQSHLNGNLFYNPRRMTIRELCFIVDSPISNKEKLYAQQIKIKRVNDLEGLYKMIPYDQNRINSNLYRWPYGEYSLIKIGAKNGGICMDQSYFVCQTAKAKGIPSILFMGQGRSGVHAWMGAFDIGSGWDFTVGKRESEKYPVGYALDPQTWSQITNSEMEYYLGSRGDSPSSLRGKVLLALALLNKDSPNFVNLIRYSSSVMPRSIEPWDIEYEWLIDNNADLKSIGRFWSRWIKNFKEESGLKARGQIALLKIFKKLEMKKNYESLSKQIISENKSKRFDLGISIDYEEIKNLQDKLKWREAEDKFIFALNNYGKEKSGGHLFYNLVQPYVHKLYLHKKNDQIEKARSLSRKYIVTNKGTILDNDFIELFDQIR